MTVPIAQAPGKADADKLTILKLLAAGRDPDFVAAAVGMSREDVVLAATKHGYPDTQKLAWAADILQKQIDDAARAATPKTPVRPVPARPLAAPAGPARTGPRPTTVPDLGVDSAAALISRGKKHDRASIRRLAERAEDLLSKLSTALDEDEEARRRAAERAAAAAKLRSEIKRLEAELAEKKRLLASGAATETAAVRSAAQAAGVAPKDVRAWALEHGIPCRPSGRIPKALVDQYLAAQKEQQETTQP